MAQLEDIVLRLGPADFLALLVLACLLPVLLTYESTLRALGSGLLGALIGLVGEDVNSGTTRFTSELLPVGSDLLQLVAIGFVLIPCTARTLAEKWLPLPQWGVLARTKWREKMVIVWRLVLLYLIAINTYAFEAVYGAFGLALIAIFGLIGRVLHRCGVPWFPLYVTFAFAPMLEENLRRALLLARGNPLEFSTRPVVVVVFVLITCSFLLRAKWITRHRHRSS